MAADSELARYSAALGSSAPPAMPGSGGPTQDWYLDFEKDIEQIRHNLRNEYFSYGDKKTPWRQAGDPLMDEGGINLFIGFLRNTAFSKNVILTNYATFNEAIGLSCYICLQANRWLHLHAALGDVGLDKANIGYINSIVLPVVKSACFRSFQAGERGRIVATQRMSLTGDLGGGGGGSFAPIPSGGGILGGLASMFGMRNEQQPPRYAGDGGY